MPGAPTTPANVYDGENVKVTWTIPTFTGGTAVALTGYKIEVLSSDSSYKAVTCIETQAFILAQASPYCSFKMLDLIASPYTLVYGNEIKVRVTASNELDFGVVSIVSTSNSNVRITPSKPSSGPSRGSSTTDS